MFFLLGDSTTTLLETIIKLVVVIILSSLIIYLCYKLANFRKSKRSKPICFTFNRDPVRQVSALTIGSDPTSNSQQFQRLLYCLRPTGTANACANPALEPSPSSQSIQASFYPQSPTGNETNNDQPTPVSPGLIVSFNDYINRRFLGHLSSESQYQLQPSVGANFSQAPIYFPLPGPGQYNPSASTAEEPKPPCPSYEEAIASDNYAHNVASSSNTIENQEPGVGSGASVPPETTRPYFADEPTKEIDSSLLSKLTSFGKTTSFADASSVPFPSTSHQLDQDEDSSSDDLESNGIINTLITATLDSDKPERVEVVSSDEPHPASVLEDIFQELSHALVKPINGTCNQSGNKCTDHNALCQGGLCVCKPGYFSHPLTGGLCRSIKIWLDTCDSDDQCRAFNQNLICDTSLYERPFCNCQDGFYFHNNTCIACLMPAQETDGSLEVKHNSSTIESVNSTPTGLQPCTFSNLEGRLRSIRRDLELGHSSSQDLQPHKSSKSYVPSFLSSHSLSSSANASDPYRIKTPLEVFMGAIILFTLFTVTWFFLHRMIHDCRSIMRSLRNPEYASNCTDLNFTVGPLTSLTTNRDGVTTANHFSDSNVTSQAIARIIANEAYGGHLTGIYQRDLAGVLVQHLAGNIPASLSGHALTISPEGLVNEHEPNLYPLAISAQQIRNGALPGAASQLILSPSNRAITILRSPAFDDHLAPDYNQISLLNSILNEPPPPKYEEAMNQANYINQQQNSEATSDQRATETTSASEAETNANPVEARQEHSAPTAGTDENVAEISNSTVSHDNDSAPNK